MCRLGREYALAGKRELFNRLEPLVLTEGSWESYHTLAEALRMSDGAVKAAIHRLRRRFRDAVRAEVAQTVAGPD